MINLTKKQEEFIRKNLKNPEHLISASDVNKVLDALDDLMLYEGFDENDEPNTRGDEIERIRDAIYANN